MSVRIGTPIVSRTRPRMRRPSTSPGPRNERVDVRFALSYDALNTTGTFAAFAMSRTAAAISRTCASLSMTHGPAMSTSGPLPMLTSPIVTGITRLPYHGGRGLGPPRDLVPVARVDEAGEQRMRLEWFRLELGVELYRDVPRMRGELDDLDELAVKGSADDVETPLGEQPFVEAVELVPV